ncbi:thermonuclease family protein [Desmospora profundinema]|uniref:Endonuclease YncB(Thermonuclease family) n=1 Tax=Desmospora profundinema TaxID=1571184 RepID=A0ABU1ILW3_9BACL|nr:thermonuclease family protein [Desmospora profundinema]MDR6225144.1 endonuclease YncB(thermonuclease family) [Desmospora profundinema]
MRRSLFYFLAVFALLSGCAILNQSAPPPTQPEGTRVPPENISLEPQQVYSSHIKRVVDGDTVHLTEPVFGSTKVRMLSIDTPETNFNGKSQGRYGEMATERLKELLPIGTEVDIVFEDEAKDTFGRLLAYIRKNGQNINLQMVREGYAVPYLIWPNFAQGEDFLNALREARENGRGIWDISSPINELPYEFRARIREKSPDKYAGNYRTKKCVEPKRYKEIPLEQRVFFWKKSEAERAGYRCKDEAG